MVYNVTPSLAMIPFNLVLLFNLHFNHRSTEQYHRRMRRALVFLTVSCIVDVVTGILSRGNIINAFRAGGADVSGFVLIVTHLIACVWVAAYLISFDLYMLRMEAEGHGEIRYTTAYKVLLTMAVPVMILIMLYEILVSRSVLLISGYLSVVTYIFFFLTEYPMHDRLRMRLDELSKALSRAQEAGKRAAEEDLGKNEFLTNMSHEIRTPLNAILGMDEMILRTSREHNITVYAGDIRNAGNSLLAIINDILDFSRIESGTLETVHAPYHLGYVLDTVWSMMTLRATDKGLLLKKEVDMELPDSLEGDGQRLQQILINLLNNAIKYTRTGSVTLRVQAMREAEDSTETKDSAEAEESAEAEGVAETEDSAEAEGVAETVRLRFDVIDTGIGIKEEDLPRLFGSYERLDAEKNRGVEGTGLGLTITHNLVRLMDGEISVESTYGKGSTFTVALPQRVIGSQTLAEYAQKEELERTGESRRFFAPEAAVLAVDDTESNLRVAEQLLMQTMINVDTCLSGEACLELMKKKTYDIILLDHMMPGMDGIETMKAARALENFDADQTKIIVLTANAIAGAREMYLEEGFDDYLSKPVEAIHLEDTMMKYLPDKKLVTASDPRYTDLLARAQEEQAMRELAADAGEDEDMKALRNVEHVDLDEALRLCAGPSLLRTTMIDFAESIDEESDLIEQYCEAHDWKNYTIKVHALKSVARLIGANELSDDARFLEGLGNAENEAEILEKTPKLLADYRAYHEYLAPVLHAADKDDTREEIDDEELEEAYEALREFVEMHDFDSADYIMETLEGYRIPEEKQARYEKIRRAVRRVDRTALLEMLA